ncbi:MAG: hypothetical protein JW822_02290 [Spirochaetales bacterium]|nr:hypothetical protein [Spirochaetales bacterium]
MEILKGILIGVLGFFLCIFLISLSLVNVVHTTVLNVDFMVEQTSQIDFALLLEDVLSIYFQNMELPAHSLQSASVEINTIIAKQVKEILTSIYAYLYGQNDISRIEIHLHELFLTLKPSLVNSLYDSLTKQGEKFPKQELEKRFDIIWEQLLKEIPATLKVDEELLSEQDVSTISDIRTAFQSFQYTYIGLIFFILLLAGLVVFVNKSVVLSLRHMGIIVLVPGVLQMVLIFLFNRMGTWPAIIERVPKYMTIYVNNVLKGFASSLQLFTIIYIIVGSLLIGASVMISMGVFKGLKKAD